MVLFGERVEQPPDLKILGNQLKKRKDRPTFGGTSLLPPEGEMRSADDVDHGGSDDDGDAGGSRRNKRNKANRLDLDALEGDIPSL